MVGTQSLPTLSEQIATLRERARHALQPPEHGARKPVPEECHGCVDWYLFHETADSADQTQKETQPAPTEH